ncbi:MAG: acyl carrier protein [Minwuiales bacterium]|nr:acyl carrier protein [Minwuiales bacterium]
MGDVDELVFRKTCKLLEPFNVRNLELSLDTNITTDLEIDSLAVLDLIMEVEEEYGISFPMNLIAEIKTVGDLVSAIHQQTGTK